MRESVVEAYLVRRVEARGGEVRKIKWIGRRHAPDRLVMMPRRTPTLVELKAPGENPRPGQVREHARLRAVGADVVTLDTCEAVDAWLDPA